jgi:predicted TIM-barrel fold metal-dependent hydrolase
LRRIIVIRRRSGKTCVTADLRRPAPALHYGREGLPPFEIPGGKMEVEAPWSSGSGVAQTKAPANACDCHMHIFEARFPVAANASIRPAPATPDDYRLVQKRTGTSRVVIVQPSTYGTDNAATLYAVAALGPGARGVAVIDDSVTDTELQRLHAGGVRGVRFNLTQKGATTHAMLEPVAGRLAKLGWHIQIHTPGDDIADNEALFARLATPIVFDHLASIPEPDPLAHRGFAAVLRLVDKGRAWVKLSGPYIHTKSGGPAFADRSKLAQAYVKAAPERLVWGSDWPHPTEPADRKPDDAGLFDLLAAWAPDDAIRNRILVDNPATLYDFQ